MGLEKTVVNEKDSYDVLIIGGGVAGLTAAIYSKRAGLKVGFYESNIPGGKIVNTMSIENMPGYKTVNGADLAYSIFDQASNIGVEYIYGKVTDIRTSKSNKWIVTTSDNATKIAKAVIIATGNTEKKLDVKNENELVNKGVSYCAICDGSLAKNLDVAIVGGGNSAITGALYLSNIANKIHLIHRTEKFTADDILLKKIKQNQNIEFHTNCIVQEIIGDQQKGVSGIIYKNTLTNDISTVNVSFVFIYVGSTPNIDFIRDLNFDANGYILSNSKSETNLDGIFAAGDCISKVKRQITTAMGDGTTAALTAIDYINKNFNE